MKYIKKLLAIEDLKSHFEDEKEKRRLQKRKEKKKKVNKTKHPNRVQLKPTHNPREARVLLCETCKGVEAICFGSERCQTDTTVNPCMTWLNVRAKNLKPSLLLLRILSEPCKCVLYSSDFKLIEK